jgi:hypothetical protein
MSEVFAGGGFILDTPKDIEAYRLLALKGALKMETIGLKSRFNVAEQIRQMIGSITRNKKKLLTEYEAWLREKGVLIDAKA